MKPYPNTCSDRRPPRPYNLHKSACGPPEPHLGRFALVYIRKRSAPNPPRRSAPTPVWLRSAPPGPEWSGRSARTALEPSSHLGWAEIRHPFHPLRGQRFEVLKTRRIAGIDTLLLRELERGSFSVAREWTDWAEPSVYYLLGLPPQRLEAGLLFELVTLLEQLTGSEQKG